MPVHVVRQGECLSSIAERYGFADPMTLYDHADNAELRQLRPNPNLLHPGDRVNVPPAALKTHDVPTDDVGRFVLKRGRAIFRLVLDDADGEPQADLPWTLAIDGEEHAGTTGSDGLIEVPIPPGATEGTLAIQPDPDDPELVHEYSLQLGGLDPVEEVSGIQARLVNLGFDCGAIDGDEGDETQEALDAFRKREGIDEEGPCGDQTRAKLLERHGC